MKRNKITALICIFALLCIMIAGCVSDNDNDIPVADNQGGGNANAGTSTTTPAPANEPEEPEEGAIGTFPIPGDHSLVYWVGLNSNVSANFTGLNETPFGQALIEQTGVNVEFLHPPAGQETEQFNLIIASMDFPDIMEINWLNDYHGGPERAISDGVIHRLNDIIDRYAPNTKNFLENLRPDLGRLVITDESSYFVFPFLRESEPLRVFTGSFMRADWLNDLNMDPPETLDEWEDILTAFRDEKGAIAPFAYQWWQRGNCPVASAYGIRIGFFINDAGNVSYGYVEDAYLDYVTRMNRWFRDGLLDPDFGTTPGDVWIARITGGDTGAALGNIGAGIGVLMNAMADDPVFDLVPVQTPVLQRGQQPRLGHMDAAFSGGHSAAITTGAQNVEVAARFLDFGFSEQGYRLYNFGVEGVSYNMVDGFHQYTDLIMENPNGWPIGQAIASVARASYGGPFVQSEDYVWQFFRLQRQRDALDLWSRADSERFVLPPITLLPDEASRIAMVLGELGTYVEEMHLRFVFGEEPLDNFDNFRDTIYRFGLQEVLDIYTEALARFYNR